MVGQNGWIVNPESCSRKMGSSGGEPEAGGGIYNRLALAEWKISYLTGYIIGASEIAGIGYPECLKKWIKS